MTTPNCVLCKSDNTTLLYNNPVDYDCGVQHQYDLYLCRQCDAIFICPLPATLDEVSNLYTDSYYTVSKKKTGTILISILETLYIRKELKRINDVCDNDGKILDIGCGSGKYLLMLKKHCRHMELYGIDISIPEELKFNKDIKFLSSDLLTLDFPDCSFDIIRMGNLIEHVTNPADVIAKAYDLLKPGGILIGETPNSSSLGHKVWKSLWGPIHAPRHLVIFNKKNFTELLCNNGFEEINISPTFRPSGWTKSLKNVFVWAKLIKPIDHRSKLYPLLLLLTAPFCTVEYLLGNSSIIAFSARK